MKMCLGFRTWGEMECKLLPACTAAKLLEPDKDFEDLLSGILHEFEDRSEEFFAVVILWF